MGAVTIAAVILACATFGSGTPLTKATTCGYESCPVPKEGMTNVHLIPHTHDDVGWLKTVDQYFYGHRNNIQIVGVQYIIDSVITELPKNPSRKFIYVETAYMRQWWDQQPDSIREKIQGLIESGQLEIISGGWSMHDEAVTHYHSIIDQFTWGFKNLDDMFGTTCARPHIGWQVDPFGHARETASLMAMMGFDALFFGRLDEADKQNRFKNREMELVWKASANQGGSSYLFTSIFHDFYYPPAGYCFDILCSDDPIIDDPRSPDYNVETRIQGFIDYINKQKGYFTTNNILVPMGTDFSYQQASTWYINLDKLIKYVNERQESDKINLMYSTPSCYAKAVHDAGTSWTAKEDDFFPYSNDEHSYWTGYFTSRPTLKFMERMGNNFLQVSKQLSVLANLKEERWQDLSSLREAMGIMQHHDAITGTEKQHVAKDYALRLHNAMIDCHSTTERALNILMTKEEAPSADTLEFNSCMSSNISACDVSENNEMFLVTLYNPQSQNASQFVRVPVKGFVYEVHDGAGNKLETQMLKIPASVLGIPGRESDATQELIFEAKNIPALGFASFYVMKINQASPPPIAVADIFVINNGKLEITFSEDLHRLESIKHMEGDQTYSITQDFGYYEGYRGDNMEANNMSSGAYLFRPINNARISVASDPPVLEAYTGALVNEFHQKYNEWVSLVTRIYKDQEQVEMEWVVGPIPVEEDDTGKEVVTIFKVNDWQTDDKFYTDSNGRETLERIKNFRPTWDYDATTEPVAGNYYPITTSISIRNFAVGAENQEFAVVTDRAQGGSSNAEGEIELMLHRRLLNDDAKGVGEALNELAFDVGLVAKGRHILFFGNTQSSPTSIYKQRKIARDNMVLYPWVFFTPTTMSVADWQANYEVEYSGLSVEVPDNVNILTLEPWDGGENVLVRVEHFLESNDDPELSKPASLPLRGLIQRIDTEKYISETTLGGNQVLTENTRLEFAVEGEEPQVSQQLPRPDAAETFDSIALNPMQIRTFVVRTNGAEASSASAATIVTLLVISMWKIFV